MQTFLPYADFTISAKCLDNKRLGKQRVECKQILLALTTEKYGWQNHPAVKMWRGYESALALYMQEMCIAWMNRGFEDWTIVWLRKNFPVSTMALTAMVKMPNWLGNQQLHDSHKSNLLRKDYNFYCQWGWEVPDNFEYYWPVK